MITKESQAKHWAEKDIRTIQSYWDSPPATLRSKWFAKQLKSYNFFSIYETGFFSGRNLRYIYEEFPNIKVGGLDVNKKAVEFAKQRMPYADLHHMNLHDFNSNKEYDIVFTSGILIHIPPKDVPTVLSKLLMSAKKYVMHIESIGNNEISAGPKHLKPTYKISDQIQFSPDLIGMYAKLGYSTKVIPLPDNCKTNGGSELLIVEIL